MNRSEFTTIVQAIFPITGLCADVDIRRQSRSLCRFRYSAIEVEIDCRNAHSVIKRIPKSTRKSKSKSMSKSKSKSMSASIVDVGNPSRIVLNLVTRFVSYSDLSQFVHTTISQFTFGFGVFPIKVVRLVGSLAMLLATASLGRVA